MKTVVMFGPRFFMLLPVLMNTHVFINITLHYSYVV